MKLNTLGVTIITIFAVMTLVFVYIAFFSTEDTIQEEDILQKKIDNRTSPLVNKGVIVEILRIRHRGLLESMFHGGRNWDQPPNYYSVVTIDGLEYVSKNVSAVGSSSEIYYTDWDTMFKENKFLKDIPEDQNESRISIALMQMEKKGIFNLRSEPVEKDTLWVTYDYRTGRWQGDDTFKDADGYGHYLGDSFEIWFNIYQIDFDTDGIPYWTEVNILETNPRVNDRNLDPDADGIPTFWEWKWGYNPFIWDDHEHLDPDVDGLENIEEYQMDRWLANPFHRDIFVETDGMVKGGLFDPPHYLFKESQQALMEQFSKHNITLHIDDGWPTGSTIGGGEMLQHYDTVSQDSGMMLQYYNNHFAEKRRGIFRYLLVGHEGAFTHPAKFHRYDTIHCSSSIYTRVFIFKQAVTPRLWKICLAAQAMHELGHSMSIGPWSIEGCDNLSSYERGAKLREYLDEWGNYHSVMNYYYLYRDKELIDYSHGDGGKNDQNDWEKIYVPFFQIGSQLVEDPTITPPIKRDQMIDKNVNVSIEGWTLNKQLTNQFIENHSGQSPVYPIEVNYEVFELVDENIFPGNRTIRVYIRPIITSDVPPYMDPYVLWSLFKEGRYENGEFMFYSLHEMIDDLIK